MDLDRVTRVGVLWDASDLSAIHVNSACQAGSGAGFS